MACFSGINTLANAIRMSKTGEANIVEPLTFDILDDVCLAVQSGTLKLPMAPLLSAESLGPLFEWIQILGVDYCDATLSGIYHGLVSARARNCSRWFDEHFNQGLIQVQRILDEPLAWNDFSIRSSRAAKAAGFSKNDAWKLTAAVGEIYGNVIEHSERIDTGYVAYATKGNTFEFVVSDGGSGVLRSLKRNSKFSHVQDSGTALELALSEGVSRHIGSGHGFGFKPILTGLANISTRVRFRSGDYGREFQRIDDSAIPATTLQLAMMEGLFCSVLCTAAT